MKRLKSSIRIAFRALQMNKLRSALTMLGIVIGVASVIATMAIGSGATQRIQQQIASIGSNIIIVAPGSIEQLRRAPGQRQCGYVIGSGCKGTCGAVPGRCPCGTLGARRSPGDLRKQ